MFTEKMRRRKTVKGPAVLLFTTTEEHFVAVLGNTRQTV
jgi:hypothetical protein